MTDPAGQDVSVFSALETRLFKYLDTNLNEIKDVIKSQSAKIDRLNEERIPRNEFDLLRRQVDGVVTDVEVVKQRIKVLEGTQSADDTSRRQRPFQTWQLVVATITVLTFLGFDFITAIINIVDLFMLLRK